MMMRFAWIIFVCCVFPGQAVADSADQLARLLAPYQQFSADFSQQVTDVRGQELNTVEGRLALDGARRFRWQTGAPFSQLIVADGEVLWIFDEDLLQVQVRPLDTALSASPAAILGGSAESLETEFSIERIGAGSQVRFDLQPRANDAVTAGVSLVFSGETLVVLEFNDALGQTTVLTLDSVDFTTPDPAQFVFVPPPDADVMYALETAP